MPDSNAEKTKPRGPAVDWGMKVLVVFGTRPEAIKLAPIIHELRERFFQTLVVTSNQHRELLRPFLKMLKIETDFNLGVMRRNQSPNGVCARVTARLDKILSEEMPDLVVVQGDTSTAMAGALAAFNRRIAVAHVEAGLRSGNINSPFPEEMNRRVVSQIATYHFAATEENRSNLLTENVPAERIWVTGNPVVDSLNAILKKSVPKPDLARLLESTEGFKRLLLTTHRRESFGDVMGDNLRTLRNFVARHRDVCLFFPVHPNPNVKQVAQEILAGKERIYLLEPLNYVDFVTLMKSAWLIVSDSGGVQEEAPSLGKPLLVLRENTERPEAVRAGIAKLIGGSPAMLNRMLEENYSVDSWVRSVSEVANPFGDGHAAKRIVKIIEQRLAAVKREPKPLASEILQSSFH